MNRWLSRAKRPAVTPTILQMEAAECGAASLAMVLGHFGRHIALETLRRECGVSRDGSKASNLLKAARAHGLVARGLKAEPEHLRELPMPAIVFVDFCHFLVVEGIVGNRVVLNDPASGRRRVDFDEFDRMFTGVVLTFAPGPGFARSDQRPSLVASLARRTEGVRLAVAFVLAASLALVLPGLVLPVFSRIFVDHVLVDRLDDWLVPLVAGMGVAALARFVLMELRNQALTRAETRLAIDGARALLHHMLRLPVAYFGARYCGEIADRLKLSDELAELLTGHLAQVVLNLVTASFFLVLMAAYDARVAAAVAILAALNLAGVIVTARINSDGHRKLSLDAGKLSGLAIAGLRDIETFKASGAEQSFVTRWCGLHANVVSERQRIGLRLAWLAAMPQLLTMATAACVLVFGGSRIMEGAITLGTLVALQSLAASFTAPIVALGGLGARLQEVRSFTERTDDVLRQPEAPAAGDTVPDRLPQGAISIRGLAFGHMPLEPPLIAGLDLDIAAGGRIALVGPSGSGKSTLGRLIAGLYEADAGTIALDGQPIGAWPRPARAAALSHVDQEIALFEGTVRDNLSLWDDTLPVSNLVAAARDAMIDEVIAARPGAWNSTVGEGGRNFSGGQRQRLEIARALATNPRILVMDEATSALDAVTEAAIMDNIRARGVTLVVIAHRLSTIRDCDEIIVLDAGKPVERGTHAALMADAGRYARLVES